MFELARENVSKDLHILMRMRGKSFTWQHAILVHHTQTAKVHVRRIVILIEREGVISIQPPQIKVAAIFRFANIDHNAGTADISFALSPAGRELLRFSKIVSIRITSSGISALVNNGIP